MKIAATGFVSEQAGSVASANALFLRALLAQGHELDFFSKASFVDPRPGVSNVAGFRFEDVDNVFFDRLRRRLQKIPLVNILAGRLDAWSYNRKLIRHLRHQHQQNPYDLCLWLGDYARGRVEGLPSVSFVQGAPGSDARSIMDRKATIIAIAGRTVWLKWRLLSMLRLSRWGLPPFRHTDHFIVGSSVSKDLLVQLYSIQAEKVASLPYPIDLELFQACAEAPLRSESGLHVLWLGRIVPRKRLELFLEGARIAIEGGLDLRLTIVGAIGFIPGYEKLIQDFPFPDRLKWIERVPRADVPALIHRHDALCQPSDQEDFGSSVAEAQACGLPVIVGATNGNADYLCQRDIHLADDRAETLAAAFQKIATRKSGNRLGETGLSRSFAEECFAIDPILSALESILQGVTH